MDFSRLPKYSEGGLPHDQNQRPTWSSDDAAVEALVDTLRANPSAADKDVLVQLDGRGMSPRDAWRLLQLVPIAFVHVVLEKTGVEFQPGYIIWNPDTSKRTHHWLRDDPFYVAGVRSARRWLACGVGEDELFPVFGRSAEWDAIQKAMPPDGRLSGIQVCEPLLVEFAG